MNKEYNFFRAIAPIPRTVRWVHKGRDENSELDCVGLVLAVYRNAGLSIDKLDVPYGEHDANRPHRRHLMVDQLAKAFERIAARTPRDVSDGDILLIGPVSHNHIAITIGATAVEMTAKGMRTTSLSRIWGFVTSVYRHKELQ